MVFGNEGYTCDVSLHADKKELPNKDFILYYSNGEKIRASHQLTKVEEGGYCAMVTFLPQFEQFTDDEGFKAIAKQTESELVGDPNMNLVRGEFIFLIDRSGSMQGDRIEMAKNALTIFLKSLPQNSMFNVVGFGSKFEYLHQESLPYSKENLEKTIQQVSKFLANFGGTNILGPLQSIFSQQYIKTFPRHCFLLTDGAVDNTREILKLIKVHNHKCRVSIIGIGNGFSADLVINGAICGRGRYELVSQNNEIMGKVVGLLDSAMDPCCDNFSLEGDNF